MDKDTNLILGLGKFVLEIVKEIPVKEKAVGNCPNLDYRFLNLLCKITAVLRCHWLEVVAVLEPA